MPLADPEQSRRVKKPLLPLAFGVVLLLPGVAFSQPDSIYAFSPDVKITEAGQYDGSSFGFFSSGQHFTAFRGDTVYVAWQESRDFTYVFFARSNDAGQTFGPNVIAAGGVNPSMRVDSAGIIYLAYQNGGDVFFRKSTDGGASFTARVKVNDDTIPQIGQETPAIAVNNKGQIFIAWIDRRLYPQSIFAAASYDGGNTFTTNVQASDSGFYAYSCDIAADDSGRVYVVWPEAVSQLNLPLRIARSDDSGRTFSYRTTVSDLPVDPSQVYALWPSAAIGEGGVLGVAWEDRRFDQNTLHFAICRDYGQTFSPSVRVDDNNTGTLPQTPSLVYRNGIFNVAWDDVRIRASDSQTVSNMYFSYSLDTGKSFVPNVDVNAMDPNRPSRAIPSLAVNEDGKAFVAWVDNRYDPVFSEIYQIFGVTGKYVQLLKGDLNLDELLSAADVVMLLNATFLRQHYPAPFQNADGNCDGRLSGADIVLLLYATFADRPFPCP